MAHETLGCEKRMLSCGLGFWMTLRSCLKKEGNVRIQTAKRLSSPTESSTHFRNLSERIGVPGIYIRNKVYILLTELLQKEERSLIDPVIKMDKKISMKTEEMGQEFVICSVKQVSGVMERI